MSEAKQRRCSGQAMIEFCVGLIVLLLLVTGIIHVGKMARISLALQGEIRADAGQEAMLDGSLGVAPEAVSDWDRGADTFRHTADDKSRVNSMAAIGAMDAVTSHSVRSDEDWQAVVDKTRRPVSMAQLKYRMGLAMFLGCVHREETFDMRVDPFIRQLVYDVPEIKIKEEIWMPQMGGLF